MASSSRPQQKGGVGGPQGLPPSAASHRKSDARRRIFRELVHIAAEQGASIELGVSTGDALQEALDRAVSLMRFAADQVDELHAPEDILSNLPPEQDPLFEVVVNPQGPDLIRPHRYLTMEREARLEVEKLAAMMTQLGIAERVVRVEEAKAALIIAAIREAAFDIGLPPETTKKLGAALRSRMEEGLQMRSAPRRGTVASTEEVRRTMVQAQLNPDLEG